MGNMGLFIPSDFHRHVDKISMECTFVFYRFCKCSNNEVSGDKLVFSACICSIHHVIDAVYWMGYSTDVYYHILD